MQTVSTAQSRELDYDGMDTEHRKLLKVVQAGGRRPDAGAEGEAHTQGAGGGRPEGGRRRRISPGLTGRELQRDDRGRPLCADVRVVLSHTAVLPHEPRAALAAAARRIRHARAGRVHRLAGSRVFIVRLHSLSS